MWRLTACFVKCFPAFLQQLTWAELKERLVGTRINPHYLACTQVTFDKKDLLDPLFDETDDVRSAEAVGDPMPGEESVITCAHSSIG